jgi:hypothetical protein
MGFADIWTNLCPPAKLYPIVMAAVVLFNIYRGTHRHAIVQAVHLVIGTVLLAILCATGFEVAAWVLLLLPLLFFVFLLALIFYDQSLFDIRRSYGPGGPGGALGPNGCQKPPAEETCDTTCADAPVC